MLLNPILRRFETWIDPFRPRANLQPPRSTLGFIWFYIGQARMPFVAMLVLGGTSAAIEAALFWFVGRLVDILGSITPGPAGTVFSPPMAANCSACSPLSGSCVSSSPS